MIENDPDDRFLTEEVFGTEDLAVITRFISGSELPLYLQETNTPPQLILLTMNANPFNGIDLVRMIRGTQGYEYLPIIVLSEYSLPEEVQAAYAAGASSFITKPSDYEGTIFKIRSFINYWFRTVELPPIPSPVATGA
jgi:CheY-like chemotaxis protein